MLAWNARRSLATGVPRHACRLRKSRRVALPEATISPNFNYPIPGSSFPSLPSLASPCLSIVETNGVFVRGRDENSRARSLASKRD